MRSLGTFILGIVIAAVVVILVIFAIENNRSVPFSFLGQSFSVSLWLIAAIPAIVGFVLALLLTTPAHAAADAEHHALTRRYRELDRAYADVRQQHEALAAQNAGLQAERDELRARLANSSPARQPVSAPGMAREGEPLRERAVEPEDGGVPRDDAAAPDGYAARESDAERTGEAEPHPTLGERMRGWLGNSERPQQEDNPDGPLAPTV